MVSNVRERIVAEAMAWVGTPYVHRGMMRGAGVDCATLLICVYGNAGVIERFEPGYYSVEWHLHRREEEYLAHLDPYVEDTTSPKPGDLVLFRFGRTVAHSGIIVSDTSFVHAWKRSGVVIEQRWNQFWHEHVAKYVRPKGVD